MFNESDVPSGTYEERGQSTKDISAVDLLFSNNILIVYNPEEFTYVSPGTAVSLIW